ncbi:MAG: hypothetical protein ACF8OB_16935 [Phycisphaeraceae bacterium JB051]
MAMISLLGANSVYAQKITDHVSVDHRGLLNFDAGRSTNLIAFGKGWKYAAQDYSLKNINKSGSKGNYRFESDFHIPGSVVKLIQTLEKVKGKEGDDAVKVTYTLKRDEPFSLETAYVAIRVPIKNYVDGSISADGKDYDFPADFQKESLPFTQYTSSFTLTNQDGRLAVEGEKMRVSRTDLRKHKANLYEVRVYFPKTKNTTSTRVSFTTTVMQKPFLIQADGRHWTPLPVVREIESGSILDFSHLTDQGPAGQYGWIVPNEDGHLVYEKKPDTRVRLVGNNLCFRANYVQKQIADSLASHFKKMGYNAVRFHHTDVDLIKGNWNAQKSDDIDSEQLDKLDYLMASMKKAGLYYSIDLYTMRRFGADEIPGWDKLITSPGVIKALVPIMPEAFDAWSKMALKWLNHVNPYTGLAMKDDPALLSICPLNEDSIASSWWNVRPLYVERFEQWKKQNNQSGDDKQLMAQFLLEVKMACNEKLAKFFKDNGVKAMISGSNWWANQSQAFTRSQFDVVDNHQYWDHPDRHWMPKRFNQLTDIKTGHNYILPCFIMPSRIWGKPFTVTEYNFCAPNQHRAEAGAMMGAYAALQDWDAIFRFAWSHHIDSLIEQKPIDGFDMVTDPLAQLTERQIILLYGRGDVKPAQKKYTYGVTLDRATQNGLGNMWSKGLFPKNFTKQGLLHQIGSQVVSETRQIQGQFEAVVSEADLPSDQLGGNALVHPDKLPYITSGNGEIISDTKQIMLHNKKGYVKVVTDKTECFVGPAAIDLAGKCLTVSGSNFFASYSASAMDGQNLQTSQKILLLHLTNVANTDMQFTDASMKKWVKHGTLPYLVHTASAKVVLKNTHPNLKLYVVDFAGRRVRQVDTQYRDGAYHFDAVIAAGDQQPAMIYELAAN